MAINWTLQVQGPGGIPVPTYGNYGGPLYSDGEILSSDLQPVDYSSPPVDALDALFLLHDQAYDSPDPLVRAQGDLAMARAIAALPDDAVPADGDLYGGGAILFGLLQMADVNGHPELVSREEAALLSAAAVQDIASGIGNADADDVAGFQAWARQAAPSLGVAAGDVVARLEDIVASTDFGTVETRLTSPDGGFAFEASGAPTIIGLQIPFDVSGSVPPPSDLSAPVLTSPSFDLPTFQAPTFQIPSIEAPTFQAPTFQAPTFQAPSVNLPSVEVPSIEAPLFQSPTPPSVVAFGNDVGNAFDSVVDQGTALIQELRAPGTFDFFG